MIQWQVYLYNLRLLCLLMEGNMKVVKALIQTWILIYEKERLLHLKRVLTILKEKA